MVEGLLIIICCVFYFIELLNTESILRFSKLLFFYITIAIFIWWIIVTPMVFYDIYFKSEDWDLIILQWQIYLTANFFMYTTFAIGLMVSEPEKK